MTGSDLLRLILADESRIASAIATGSQWDQWMQIEMALLLQTYGIRVACEIPYPAPWDNLVLTQLAEDSEGRYAIALSTENSSIYTAMDSNARALPNFSIDGLKAKWAVGIAYSASSKSILERLKASYPEKCITQEVRSIRALVWDVSSTKNA